jgi:TctA family transporter
VFSSFVGKIKYKVLCLAVIVLICILVFVFSGFAGVFILATSSAIGLLPILTGVGRNNSMGCLLLPVIIYLII